MDKWLKPSVRHKIHNMYHDRFRELLTELRFVKPDHVIELKVLKKWFHEVDDDRKDLFTV